MRLKRCFDVIVCSALLLAVLPLMAVIAVLIRVLNGRPVLHRAVRSGCGGRPFVMYKFRTMTVGRIDVGVTGPDDPRVTRLGRLLRQGRLDELPQLFNVLAGDMSLVGPRPEDPRFVSAYTEAQKQVLTVRPGITSPAAVRYRNEADLLPTDHSLRDAYYAEFLLPQKLDLDLEYVARRSFVGDLRIIGETVATLLPDGDDREDAGAGSVAKRSAGHPGFDGASRRIVLLGELDRFANGVRAREVARYLRSRGHEVTFRDTGGLSRASTRARSPWSKVPRPTPRRLALYLVEVCGLLLRRSELTRRRLSYWQILAELRLRRGLLRATIDTTEADLVVCETPHDATYVASLSNVRSWYDCPTPWADELYYEDRLTPRQHQALRARERGVFEAVDLLSFHWHSYADYARDEYGLSRDDVVDADWGCVERPRRAQPAQPARVVYLGSLSSRFIDLPLLSRLCRRYPHVDVFGAPEPDRALGLPYRGYATPEILDQYQFGLITCSQDPLRRRGFSAKHLEYLAAGLPVLVPRWRDTGLEGSVPYDETGFVDAIAEAGEPQTWTQLSLAAHRQAAELTWDRTLAGLDAVICRLSRA